MKPGPIPIMVTSHNNKVLGETEIRYYEAEMEGIMQSLKRIVTDPNLLKILFQMLIINNLGDNPGAHGSGSSGGGASGGGASGGGASGGGASGGGASGGGASGGGVSGGGASGGGASGGGASACGASGGGADGRGASGGGASRCRTSECGTSGCGTSGCGASGGGTPNFRTLSLFVIQGNCLVAFNYKGITKRAAVSHLIIFQSP